MPSSYGMQACRYQSLDLLKPNSILILVLSAPEGRVIQHTHTHIHTYIYIYIYMEGPTINGSVKGSLMSSKTSHPGP